jgi:hypothetical protein
MDLIWREVCLTVLESMISGLQRPALLGVHGRSLFGRDGEEGGIKDSRILVDGMDSSGGELSLSQYRCIDVGCF